jgi:signal transduction histidine kinase
LKPNLQDANLAELIEGALITINIPKGIEATTDIKNTAKPLKTGIAYVRRILANLMTNAVPVMEGQGKLTVQASKNKNTVSITVQDTGVVFQRKLNPNCSPHYSPLNRRGKV